jgi:hypothetical protein
MASREIKRTEAGQKVNLLCFERLPIREARSQPLQTKLRLSFIVLVINAK